MASKKTPNRRGAPRKPQRAPSTTAYYLAPGVKEWISRGIVTRADVDALIHEHHRTRQRVEGETSFEDGTFKFVVTTSGGKTWIETGDEHRRNTSAKPH